MRSRRITELLKVLELKGCLVTIDAMQLPANPEHRPLQVVRSWDALITCLR